MWRVLFGLFVCPALLVLLAWLGGKRDFDVTWVAVNVLSFPVITAVSIALHEAGHALAARLLALRVRRVEVGIGRRIARWRWRNVRIQLNAFPTLGLTYVTSRSSRAYRLRWWLVVLAGPLVNLALVWTAVSACDLRPSAVLFPTTEMVIGPATLNLIAFMNLWMLIGNLLPLRAGAQSNDGSLLLRIPRLSPPAVRDNLATESLLDFFDYLEEDQLDAALIALDEATRWAPSSSSVRSARANLHLQRGENEEARAILVELVDERAPISRASWVIANNLAWTNFLLRRPELQTEADRLSEVVLEKHPLNPWVLGTRGAVLGWLGWHELAIAPLKQAFTRHSSSSSRALNACCLAISYAALGQPADAERWLSRARAEHAACRMLDEAAAACAAAREPAPLAM